MPKSLSSVDNQVQEIIKIVKENYPDGDIQKIQKAYDLAKEAHGDQLRRSGEPYIIHPVAVAYILANYKMDVDTIVAALLHDVIEDTKYTYEDLKEIFNENIAYMVESVSKMTRLNYLSKEESQAEYIRKMVFSMSNDIRIIIIKLVDRLHNMRTLEYMSTNKQQEKSRETLEIYAPIANRLGIQSIKAELEDLSFKYLDPDSYNNLLRKVESKRISGEEYLRKVVAIIKKRLEEAGIEAKVYGRMKHLYSLYMKIRKTGRSLDQIYDFFAVRIITKSVEDCYAALGVIHTTWNAIPSRMKDYINVPKPNGYQSFHTTVIGPDGTPLEIQIRSEEMHERNEYGVAAHWKYKEGRKNNKKDEKFDKGISWLRQLIDWSHDFENASDFLETMKVDILDEEVYVYTPKGEIVELPVGSCPIDFAYRIHTDIGNKCIGAKVNDQIVPLNYRLQLGDIVTIMTSNNSDGPNRDWLKIVKSKHAKNKILQYFKRANREENIHNGKTIYETEVKKLGAEYETLLSHSNIEKFYKSLGLNSENDFYLNIGTSSLTTGALLNKLKNVFPELFNEEKEELVYSSPSKFLENDILVQDKAGIETHMAKCCNPIPGDKIIGYNTITNGISVHRIDCENIINSTRPDKFINVNWASDKIHQKYSAELYIKAVSQKGGLMDILKPFYELNIPIISSYATTDDNIDTFDLVFEIKNLRLLSQLITQLKRIPDVLKVTRK